MKKYLPFLFFIVACSTISAQSISGYIVDANQEKLPFVNIFVQQLETGTTTDEEGHYFISLTPGIYNLVITSIGFEDKQIQVEVDGNEKINFQLSSSYYELNEITVTASKKDPAYAIIAQAIKNKEKYKSSIQSLKANVYIKATEEIEIKEKAKRVDTKQKSIDDDPFKVAEEAKKQKYAKHNFLETELTLNYQYPNKYKDEKIAYKVYGNKEGLYIPRFDEVNFDFYNNLVKMYEITSTPIVSPLSKRAILSYKYKLIESNQEGQWIVHKIKVIPRKKGNATVNGYIYINDQLWNINRIDFKLAKNNMKLFDKLNIKMNYHIVKDSIWYPTRQELVYESKVGKKKKYKGRTVLSFTDLELDYPFPDDFFGSEVSILTQEAMDKDSVYWNANRPEPLVEKEQALVLYRDSIETVINSPAYKDSMQRIHNKLTLVNLLFYGHSLQFHKTKESFTFPSLIDLFSIHVIGGYRLGANGSYYKRFKSERAYNADLDFSIGLTNSDLIFSTTHWFRYNPMKQGDVLFQYSKNYYPLNINDAYLNYLKSSNYYQHNRIILRHSRELFNGFELYTGVEWSDRQDVSHLNTSSIFAEVIDPGEIIKFDPYKTFKTNINIHFTPFRKFITEPKRKVILGSKWPTFSLKYEKGWNKLFKSALDYDYLELSIKQNIVSGTLGTSKYNIIAGNYFNTKKLNFIDIKNIRQADPLLYSEPLVNFQVLDTGFVTSKPFIEMHYIHHFNGALINNIPLVKLTKVSVVAGGGFLYAQENGINHQELFLGLERIFRLGPRRRLRLGFYGVGGTYHTSDNKIQYKISIDIIDTWQRDWSF